MSIEKINGLSSEELLEKIHTNKRKNRIKKAKENAILLNRLLKKSKPEVEDIVSKDKQKKGKTNLTKKVSTKREECIAEETDGRRHVGSGSLWWKKSDASDDDFQYEDKFTESNFFVLSRNILDKIKKEALDVNKIPVVRIGFVKNKKDIYNVAILRAKDCVLDKNILHKERYVGRSCRVYLAHLKKLFNDPKLEYFEVSLQGNYFIVFEWNTFLELRSKILEGGVLK